jgi:hypothetical protein
MADRHFWSNMRKLTKKNFNKKIKIGTECTYKKISKKQKKGKEKRNTSSSFY